MTTPYAMSPSLWNPTQMSHLTNSLIATPMVTLEDWPFWIGFTALEYASTLAQEAVKDMTPVGWRNLTGAITRGAVTTMMFEYWDLGKTY